MLVRALQCVDMAAGADAVLERTVAHVRGREQFGRAIASFQAAQHLVADVHIAVQAARLAARSAVFWHGRGRPAVRETAVAVLRAATACRRATLDGHQLHGGMGYVVETDLHLWSERARLLGALGGGPDVAAGWLEEEIARG
nr:acyl-CoA dehydrogenase family protein [Nocardioides ochotonae]